MHSSKKIIASEGKAFAKKKVVLCITGSVAAARCPELARALMRQGAEVHCVMSESAQKLIGKDLLHWATGNPVITELTGETEHITYCGDHEEKASLLLVMPSTANTISKIARGIDDTPVTTFASTALGSKTPIVIVPAMHYSLYANPFVSENLEKLERAGVSIVPPRLEGGKAKIAENQEIMDYCERALARQPLAGKTVLVTAGPTREYADDVRFISNPSTGKMGVEIARQAWVHGARVLIVAGNLGLEVPSYLTRIAAFTAGEMRAAVKHYSKSSDIIILAAAPADYQPEKQAGKISSRQEFLSLRLRATAKTSDSVKKWSPKAMLVLFKAESRKTDKELKKAALEKLRACKADLIVANDISREGAGFAVGTNQVLLIDKKGKARKIKGTKKEVAEKIVGAL